MKTLICIIKKSKIKYLPFLIFYLFTAFMVSMSNIYITKMSGSIGQAAISLDLSLIKNYLLTMALLTGVKVIFSCMSTLFSKRFTGKAEYTLRDNFVRHYSFVPYADATEKSSGENLSLYTSDLNQAAEFMTTGTFELIMESMSAVVSIIFMFLIQPWLTLLFLVLIPPLSLLQIKISNPIEKHMIKASTYRGNFNAVVGDSLQNTSTIVSYSLEDVMEERYLESYNEYYNVFLEYITSYLKLVLAGISASMIPILIAYIGSAIATVNGNINIGEFIIYITIASTANEWLSMLSQRIGRLRVQAAGAERLLRNTAGKWEEDTQVESKSAFISLDKPAITFQNVDFSYNEDSKILSGLSFSIPSGSRVAIVGASGCGKSTILKLLLSLYETNSGHIELFGCRQNTLSKNEIRNLIAYVPQDSFLLPGTIKENITCVNEEKREDSELLKTACRYAGILNFIENLPQGFDTPITEAAENLSGGQRQRIAIARAFFKDSPLVLLDEATSALDVATEKEILDSFFDSLAGKTAIVVTHRLAAAKVCDHILVMKKGILVEEGTYEQLMAANSVFSALYNSQLLEEANGGYYEE